MSACAAFRLVCPVVNICPTPRDLHATFIYIFLLVRSGMDNVRNCTGSPLAGIDPEEILDTRPFCTAISNWLTNNNQGNPEVSNLPRKWNPTVVGAHDARARRVGPTRGRTTHPDSVV